MYKAFYTLDLTEAVLLKDHLVHNGIPAKVRNKGAVRIPHDGIASEVWVADEINGDEVLALTRAFLRQRNDVAADSTPSWQCHGCQEANPGEFEYCWHCGENPPRQ
jgi:hypothetical protein